MATEVTICNLALSRLGEDASITSINPPEGSEQAAACSHFYSVALNTMLESHDWRFATRRIPLARYTTEDTHGWRYAFAWPSNCLRIISLRHQITQTNSEMTHLVHDHFAPPPPPGIEVDYEVESSEQGNIIYTDCAEPVAIYIENSVSPARFSPSFADALSWLIASYLAGELTKGTEGIKISQSMFAAYRTALGGATRLDANQQRRPVKFIPEWIRRR